MQPVVYKADRAAYLLTVGQRDAVLFLTVGTWTALPIAKVSATTGRKRRKISLCQVSFRVIDSQCGPRGFRSNGNWKRRDFEPSVVFSPAQSAVMRVLAFNDVVLVQPTTASVVMIYRVRMGATRVSDVANIGAV